MARAEALSRERIVGAAVELLDAAGEGGLTFRALAANLRTGAGAIYWHVADKGELLNAATDAVLSHVLTAAGTETPQDTVRTLGLAAFDAIDAHPWAGTYLSRVPAPPAQLRIFERIGQQMQRLDVPVTAQFDAATALLNYILGVAGQNANNARALPPGTNRREFLTRVSATWANLDAEEFPFARGIAGRLAGHDDRAQFRAGVDLILAGIKARS
jgi:AcrR family transcriptional regulator